MSINEVFENPTVKQVIFQINFPNLFFLENKIGDFQLKIMDKFPESSLLYRQQFVLADMGPSAKLSEVHEPERGKKIWQFVSPEKVQVNVLSDSLDLNSQFHKTYQNPSSSSRFRDAIQYVVDNFLEVTKIPKIVRIGLRYIDDCPLPEEITNDGYREYYNTTFPIGRFNLNDTNEMQFQTLVKRGEYFLRYIESLRKNSQAPSLTLDFDAFATAIDAKHYLKVCDDLHTIIIGEYEKTLKEPVFAIMRKPKE